MAYKAAFSREDVGDAKRGQPALSLSEYAAGRGCEGQEDLEQRIARMRLQGRCDRTLVVRRNGYIADPGQLDELCTIAGALARNARDACRARLQRKPFEEPLEPPRGRWAASCRAALRSSRTGRSGRRRRPPGTGSRWRARSPTTEPFRPRPCPGSRTWSCAARCLCWAPPAASSAVRLEVRDGLAGIYTVSSYWGNAMAGDVDALLAAAAFVLRGYL